MDTSPSKRVIERHLNTKRKHIIDGDRCWCHPRVEEHVNEHCTTLVVTHNLPSETDIPDGAVVIHNLPSEVPLLGEA